jgi:plastocyanin
MKMGWPPGLCAAGLLSLGPTLHAAPLSVHASDATGKPLADVVVAVVVKGQRATASPGTSFELAQKDRQFQPRLAVIQTGTAVHFPNFDTVRHHVYSFSSIKRFELKLYAGTPSLPVVFDQPGFASLGCNIHDGMLASVVVVDTPFFGLTNAAGQAVIDVPAGEHGLRFWHASMADAAQWAGQALNLPKAGARVALVVVAAAAAPLVPLKPSTP